MLPQWCVDMRDKFSIGQLASLFDQGACFLGADSSLLHVAGATFIPIAGVFTSVLPEYRLPYRNGELGKNCIGIQPALACVGCQGRHPPPRTTELCSRGDYACASMVEAEQMIEAVLKLTGK
jgi:ADP-heptose:LPS heptosyltransferase